MGGVLACCCGEEEDGGADMGERTRLISEGTGHGSTLVPDGLHCEGRDGIGGLSQVYSKSVPKEGRDELSALNVILQDTATEIIDIASIEHVQGVEQADYVEKAALYGKRMAQVGNQLVCRHKTDTASMVEVGGTVTALEGVMAGPPIQQTHLALITDVAAMMERAVAELEVDHREELVVPFGV